MCVKLGVSIFLVGLAVRLLLWDSFSFSSVVESPPLEDAKAVSPVLSSSDLQPFDSDDFPESNQNQTQISKDGKRILLLLW